MYVLFEEGRTLFFDLHWKLLGYHLIRRIYFFKAREIVKLPLEIKARPSRAQELLFSSSLEIQDHLLTPSDTYRDFFMGNMPDFYQRNSWKILLECIF